MPVIEVCCVPIALISTEGSNGTVLRWVELRDLERVDPSLNPSEPDQALPSAHDILEKS